MKAKKPEKFQVIGLVGRTKMHQHKPFLMKLKKHLEAKNCKIMWDSHLTEVYGESGEYKQSMILRHSNMVLTLGGDGTVLKVMRDLPKRKDLYIFGVNLGNLGFHTETQKSDKVFQILDEFFKGKFHLDERLVLR